MVGLTCTFMLAGGNGLAWRAGADTAVVEKDGFPAEEAVAGTTLDDARAAEYHRLMDSIMLRSGRQPFGRLPERSRASSGAHENPELPGGLDAMEVVRTVERNRGVTQDWPGAGAVQTEDEVGSPFHIGGAPVYLTAAHDQDEPAVGFDGTDYLVAWTDWRSGTSDIYGARVSADGTVLDPSGIAISTAANWQQRPRIGFDGTKYLVIWEDYRHAGPPDYFSDVYGTRVGVDGTVLDPDGIAISTALFYQDRPTIRFDGTNYLIVWEFHHLYGLESDIHGVRVNTEGVVLDPAGLEISTAPNDQYYPTLAFDGTNYLVVWGDYRSESSWDIYGARVNPGGVVLDSSGIAISSEANSQGSPVVEFDGTNYLVVWQDDRGGSSDIYGARVSTEGTVLDSSGVAISAAANNQSFPAVVFDGTNYFVAWTDSRGGGLDIYGARVNVDGVVFDSSGIAISTANDSQGSPAVGLGSANHLVVWGDFRNGEYSDCYGARVSMEGVVLDSSGVAISTAANIQNHPAVAFDGANYLTVWTDYRSGSSWDIYGARVSMEGALLDSTGIEISTAANDQESPAIAFDGTYYLVVWQDDRSGGSDIYATRVSTGGIVLDASGIAISTAANGQSSPAVGFDGVNYLVVWSDSRSGDLDVYGARVSMECAVLDASGIAISTASNGQRSPSVAFDGVNYLAVWEDLRNGGYSNVYCARVSTEGVVLDASGIAISIATNRQHFPAVGFDGTNYLVVWEQRYLWDYSDLHGARVSTEGIVLDSPVIEISIADYDQFNPALRFDGTNYLVAWEDHRSGNSWDIYGAQVSVEGVVLDPGGEAISTAANDQLSPDLASGPADFVLAAYSSFVGPPYGSYRIWGNVWGSDSTAPQVTVVKPNGGETFYATTQDTIRWIASDNIEVEWVDLFYSTDGGSSYPHTIATGEPNDSIYIWTIPDTLAGNCKVKAVAYDPGLSEGEDTSDAAFTITIFPSVPALSSFHVAVLFALIVVLVVVFVRRESSKKPASFFSSKN
jgi:hypothetical protein